MDSKKDIGHTQGLGVAKGDLIHEILEAASQNELYAKALTHYSSKYHLSQYKILGLTPQKVREEFGNLRERFYINGLCKSKASSWFDRELRIFIWALVCYAYIHKRTVESLTPLQLVDFSHAFGGKEMNLILFQAKLLSNPSGKGKNWLEEEDQILKALIGPNNQTNSWNDISKQLYQISEQKFFRTPKQCRERWLNHLDPSVLRSEWTLQEDVLLLEQVIKIGKKWAQIKRILELRRTEHCVKNRYNSLLRPYLETDGRACQKSIASRLLYRLKRQYTQRMLKEQKSIEQSTPADRTGDETPISQKENNEKEQNRLNREGQSILFEKLNESLLNPILLEEDECSQLLFIEQDEEKFNLLSQIDQEVPEFAFDFKEF